jgi:hypothetical protein
LNDLFNLIKDIGGDFMMPSRSVPLAVVICTLLCILLYQPLANAQCHDESFCNAGFMMFIFPAAVFCPMWIISNIVCWVLYSKSKQDLKDHISRIPLYIQTTISIGLAVYAFFVLALLAPHP